MYNLRTAAIVLGVVLAACSSDSPNKNPPWSPIFPPFDAGSDAATGGDGGSAPGFDSSAGDMDSATGSDSGADIDADLGEDAAVGTDAGDADGSATQDDAALADAGGDDAGADPGDASTPNDASAEPDANVEPDASAEPDASTEPDASAEADASTGLDAGPEEDASVPPDAAAPEDAGPSCGPPNSQRIGGNSCPGVVTCQDTSGPGTEVLACVLRSEDGSTVNRCCIDFGPHNSCRPSACSLTQGEASCDGPEDCSGGRVCCRDTIGTGTSCQTSCGSAANQLCHTDADCPGNTRCLSGTGGALNTHKWWGFCRG